jgi:hypothetical protein
MDNIPFINYLACIISRLTYFDNTDFLEKYTQSMNIQYLSKQLPKIKNIDEKNIFIPKTTHLLEISKSINSINYKKVVSFDSNNVKYIIISTSNFSSVYLIADKRSNSIFIAFRGTSSLKSGLSYLKITSILPFNVCDKNNDGYLVGIYKIVSEIFYTISEGIHFLINSFLQNNNVKLITTGHSLGGGCAQIFSYLWIKINPFSKICCITFGSPRVMNNSLIQKYIKLINKGKIQFKRIVTYGDPFAELPLNIKFLSPNKSFFHIDDTSDKLETFVVFCNNYKKTRKVICTSKNKTKRSRPKPRPSINNHSSYLSINYDKAAQGLTNLKKEIHRDTKLNTICRIIVGGENEPCKVSFFNLQNIKTPYKTFIKNITMKISKKLLTDYKHQDIYMNSEIFNELIKQSSIIDKDNLNPLKTDKYIDINEYIKNPNKKLMCL